MAQIIGTKQLYRQITKNGCYAFLFLNKKNIIQDKVKEAFKTIHCSECVKRYKILPSVK